MWQKAGKGCVGPESCQWPSNKVESLHLDIKIVKYSFAWTSCAEGYGQDI